VTVKSGIELGSNDAVTRFVHGSLDVVEWDLGVAGHGQLTAVEINLHVGDSANGENLFGDRTRTVLAVHPGDDVLAGDGQGYFLLLGSGTH
jgi:hypothetical protein